MHRPVTIEELERGLLISAQVVSLHGDVYLPIFERLERELFEKHRQQAVHERARHYLEASRRRLIKIGQKSKAEKI